MLFFKRLIANDLQKNCEGDSRNDFLINARSAHFFPSRQGRFLRRFFCLKKSSYPQSTSLSFNIHKEYIYLSCPIALGAQRLKIPMVTFIPSLTPLFSQKSDFYTVDNFLKVTEHGRSLFQL